MNRASGTRVQPQATKATRSRPGTTRQSATTSNRLRFNVSAKCLTRSSTAKRRSQGTRRAATPMP